MKPGRGARAPPACPQAATEEAGTTYLPRAVRKPLGETVSPRNLHDELDPRFHKRQQVVQRALWVVMAAIIGAALLGYLGTSPLSTDVVKVDEAGAHYELERPRFTRYELAERMQLRVDAPQAQGEELKVSFSRDFVENNAITSVTPDSDGGGGGPDGATYAFQVDDWSQPLVLSFAYEPRKSFRSPGEMTVQAGESAPVKLSLDQWVYP